MKFFLVYFTLIFIIITTIIEAKPSINSDFYNEHIFNLKDSLQNENTCGYQSCPEPKPDMLNLHLVAHSHDDVGWLKTVDQYYYGSRTNIQKAGVQYILDSAINELLHDKNKKFIYVETAFLWKWWQEQSDNRRHQVKQLINNGQLEIIGGAWSMNDEAASHYHSIIDQFTWGFRRLNDTFGKCAHPKIGWQIDPFGHSREMASIFAQLGFDGLFIGRLDYQDKAKRLKEKTPEMIWRGSPNLGAESDLFTGVLFNNYGPPPGFCFDVLCSDDPIIDDVNSPDYNVDERINKFIEYTQKQAQSYETNNIILTMGEDFHYQDANMWYKNLDKLIFYINKLQDNGNKVNAFYSTPSCYLKALNNANKIWPTKTDDFFPYASDPHAFWTGYFTSRPTTKYFERQGNNMLQVCKQLATLTQNDKEANPPDQLKGLIALREAMGVMQHHDAITGTEKQHVTHDYVRLLTDAVNKCSDIVTDSLNKLLTSKSSSLSDLHLTQCALNISQCNVSEDSETFAVVVYNPSSQPINKYIRVPVIGESYSVEDPNGTVLETQIVPIPSGVLNIPGRFSLAINELIFLASNIPPLGYKTYYVAITKDRSSYKSQSSKENSMGNAAIRLSINEGQITKIVTSDQQLNFSQEYLYYEGAVGNNEIFENRSSGAYIFRPNSTAVALDKIESTLYKGPLVEELHQVISPWINNVVRVYRNTKYVEFDWVVGPIPIQDGKGKEVISKFKTDLDTKGIFYTDSNGRELLRRERNKRDTWDLDLQELIAGNYYPVTSRIVLTENSTNSRFTVVNDRAQGGSSINDGEVELMIHRRLLHDDAFGVGEALNETAFGTKGLVVRGSHYVLSGRDTDSTPTRAAEDRKFAAQNVLEPIIYFANLDNVKYEHFDKGILKQFNGLSDENVEFPSNVQVLTLEPWKNGTVLLRLEHILEKDEDPILSKPTCVNIENLFATFTVKDVKETALGANQLLSEVERLKWNSTFSDLNLKKEVTNIDNQYTFEDTWTHDMDILYNRKKLLTTNQINKLILNVNRNYKCSGSNSEFEITLTPMQIRTFILTVALK